MWYSGPLEGKRLQARDAGQQRDAAAPQPDRRRRRPSALRPFGSHLIAEVRTGTKCVTFLLGLLFFFFIHDGPRR